MWLGGKEVKALEVKRSVVMQPLQEFEQGI
jgi:hypothetical protein